MNGVHKAPPFNFYARSNNKGSLGIKHKNMQYMQLLPTLIIPIKSNLLNFIA